MGKTKELERVELLTKNKFFHLQPKEFYYKESRGGERRMWKCLCDCGNMIDREESTIIRNLTQSCGCMHPRNTTGEQRESFKGFKQLTGQYLSSLRNRAKSRNLIWDEDITPEYLWNLYEAQNKKCKLSNLEIKFESLTNQKKGLEQTASLDRIDSTKGYIKGNVQWLHKDINKMKMNLSEERFIELCSLIIKTISLGNQSRTNHEQLPEIMED